MNCRECRRLLYLGRDADLTAVEKETMDAHLARCSRCAAEKAAYEKVAGLASAVSHVEFRPDDPDALDRRIIAGLPRRTARLQVKEPHFSIDRVLDLLTAPAFRLATSGSIVAIISLFLFQSYGILRDVHDLEVRQERQYLPVDVPHLNYAVDVRPLHGTPEGELLVKLNVPVDRGYLVVNGREAGSLRGHDVAFAHTFASLPVSGSEKETLQSLVGYLVGNVHPLLSFTREGV
jgi:hypothetical protein